MPKRTVKQVVDPTRLPGLTWAQRAELAALRDMPDARIDTSDIAPLDDGFWARAVRNPFYRPTKQAITVRIDADVLACLKAGGKGYQRRLNAILGGLTRSSHEMEVRSVIATAGIRASRARAAILSALRAASERE